MVNGATLAGLGCRAVLLVRYAVHMYVRTATQWAVRDAISLSERHWTLKIAIIVARSDGTSAFTVTCAIYPLCPLKFKIISNYCHYCPSSALVLISSFTADVGQKRGPGGFTAKALASELV